MERHAIGLCLAFVDELELERKWCHLHVDNGV
jgi:hypothetical protein